MQSIEVKVTGNAEKVEAWELGIGFSEGEIEIPNSKRGTDSAEGEDDASVAIGPFMKMGREDDSLRDGSMMSVLILLRKHKLYAKESKCSFGQTKVEYLGYIITKEGVSTDPSKVESMVKWPIPKTLKKLRGFLGLTGYYRKFVKNYGLVSKPLTNLLRKDGFKWSQEAEEAFHHLKQSMSTTPVLALPDFTLPFEIETDASGVGVGAVLMQKGRPIAYMSKALCARNQCLSIYEKEFLAVLMAIQRWRHYLQGHKFIIKTDQQALKHLLDQKGTDSAEGEDDASVVIGPFQKMGREDDPLRDGSMMSVRD
ncbi:Uncharacterized mitochondrial protein AtMg00860 [Striga hermonthica]|uniref:Uncharacterized mitochondrial protein AtMg00860 n=1 Tax=Striga hermonthica TaxID=68872 RepID=A0A9N7NBH6_STRHE|nr:Uncharacterized mitochondrial protein AtMg00860 [Striga hermonthica]